MSVTRLKDNTNSTVMRTNLAIRTSVTVAKVSVGNTCYTTLHPAKLLAQVPAVVKDRYLVN